MLDMWTDDQKLRNDYTQTLKEIVRHESEIMKLKKKAHDIENRLESIDTFKTDGELYDASLTRDTKEEAFQLYKDIISGLEKHAAIDILDIVCRISHFPTPRNLVYAGSHGYARPDVVNFTVRPTDDGKKWCVYLGSPRKLW